MCAKYVGKCMTLRLCTWFYFVDRWANIWLNRSLPLLQLTVALYTSAQRRDRQWEGRPVRHREGLGAGMPRAGGNAQGWPERYWSWWGEAGGFGSSASHTPEMGRARQWPCRPTGRGWRPLVQVRLCARGAYAETAAEQRFVLPVWTLRAQHWVWQVETRPSLQGHVSRPLRRPRLLPPWGV